MNSKLQKVNREIERAKAKIAELQTLLPELEKAKTELENAEVIKVFRSVDVAPEAFTAFIEAYRANTNGCAPPEAPRPQKLGSEASVSDALTFIAPASEMSISEDMNSDEE